MVRRQQKTRRLAPCRLTVYKGSQKTASWELNVTHGLQTINSKSESGKHAPLLLRPMLKESSVGSEPAIAVSHKYRIKRQCWLVYSDVNHSFRVPSVCAALLYLGVVLPFSWPSELMETTFLPYNHLHHLHYCGYVLA